MRQLGALGLILFSAAWTAGCQFDSALLAQRRALESEHQARMEELSRLEVRLLALAATSREWEELGTRHQGVTELACAKAAEHLDAMERHVAWQDEKVRRARAQERIEAARDDDDPVKLSAAPTRGRRPAN